MHRVKKRKINITICLTLFLLLFCVSTVYADWQVYKRAQLKNKQGHYLRFETVKGNVRIRFKLGQKHEGVFTDTLPVYRVDQNAVHEVKRTKQYEGLYVEKGESIRWIISAEETPSDALQEFMNGKEVVFQYNRDDGKIMEAVFFLEDIKQRLEDILH